MGCCDDPDRVRMGTGDIVKNVIFSAMVLLCIMLATIGVATYEWIQIDEVRATATAPLHTPVQPPRGGTAVPIHPPRASASPTHPRLTSHPRRR